MPNPTMRIILSILFLSVSYVGAQNTCDQPVCLSIENISDTPFCSTAGVPTEAICDQAGTCSDAQYTTKSTCEASGACSDTQYTTKTTCEGASKIWTMGTWSTTWFTGSLDIKMKNQPGCSHYVGTTKTFDPSITQVECDALASGGDWYSGNVVAFQFVIKSESFKTYGNSITGGSALATGYTVNVNSGWERDTDNDGVMDIGGTMILGFNTSLTPIVAGDAALVTIGFTDYANDSVCFEDLNCDGGCNNTISGPVDPATGQPVSLDVEWGDCYCAPVNGNAVTVDCAGTCGGLAALDACGVCSGTCITFNTDCPDGIGGHYCDCLSRHNDCSGECGGFKTEDCAGNCDGGAVLDCADECNGTAPDADSDGVCDSDDVCPETQSNVPVDATGVWIGCSQSQEDALAIMLINANIPAEFTISQNYPNPFNPVTSISFDVAEIDEISLIVYDLSGKEVITLASGTFMPGSYLVHWDAVNNYGDAIASGMYVYRYLSSDKAITRKMLYLK